MLDPTMINYIDALVNQLVKKPDTVLERLQSPHQPPHIQDITMSKFLYFNGQPLPLPQLSNDERCSMRDEIDKALERLTTWEATPRALGVPVVPQLNLREIKRKHDKMRTSHEGSPEVSPEVCHVVSPEVYTTAREEPLQGEDEENEEPAPQRGPEKRRTWDIPVCQYSTSPMLSKAYKPLVEAGAAKLGPAIQGPAIQGPAIQGPAIQGVEIQGAEIQDSRDPESIIYNVEEESDERVPISPHEEMEVMAPPQDPTAGTPLDNEHAEALVGNERAEAPLGKERAGELLGKERAELAGTRSDVPDLLDTCTDYTEFGESQASEEYMMGSIAGLPSSSAPMFFGTPEKSPPSSQVLKHLEALEAAIELDLTMHSTPGSTAKRRLQLNSPPPSPDSRQQGASSPGSAEDRRRCLNLNLSGKVGSRRLPEPASSCSSPTDSRKSISFYVEVDSPRSPRSPSGLARRNTIASPRSSPRLASPRSRQAGSPRSEGKMSKPFERSRSVSDAVFPAAPDTAQTYSTETPSSGVALQRRIRHESYNTSSQVLDARASKITALVRGYLTRALIKSYKIQQHVKTVRDTNEILSSYGNTGQMTSQDRAFYNRLRETLQQTKAKVHAIFFESSITEQMALIAHTRAARRDLLIKELQGKLAKTSSARRKMSKKSKQKAWI